MRLSILEHNIDRNGSIQNTTSQVKQCFYKLPYLGRFSTIAQSKIRRLLNRYCHDLDIKLVFTVWEMIGKLITPQQGEVSPLILQLVVGVFSSSAYAVKSDGHAQKWSGVEIKSPFTPISFPEPPLPLSSGAGAGGSGIIHNSPFHG